MSKKIFSILLICCFLASSVFAVGVSATEPDVPAWNFDATGLLTINSASVLEDYTSAQDVPWNLFSSLITTVSIDSSISYIGAYSLNNLNATVQIDNGNTTIAAHAFDNAGENFVIVSVFNSPVHTYAKENGLAFEGIATASGTCGDNASWKIYSDGTLHILGSGDMTNYYGNPTSTPWYSYASTITSVLVDEDITFVSPYTVFSASSCTSATILGADTEVSSVAFQMVDDDFTIYGHLGSSAQEVAEIRGYNFEAFTVDSGTCGLNVTWTLYTNGLLKLDGTGPMTQYNDPSKLPYFTYREQVTAMEIGKGITELSNFTVCIMENCTSLVVPNPSIVFPSTTIAGPYANIEIRGYYGSTAEAFATTKSMSFAPISPILAGGTCGTSVSWYLHENGVLRISGTGAMTTVPWNGTSYTSQITAIDISEGITSIPGGVCYYLSNCTSFTVRNPDTVIHSAAIRQPADDLTVYGEFGSTAEAYAEQIGVAFDSFILNTGSCGTDLTWTLYTNGHLKITGNGGMPVLHDPTPQEIPWYTYKDFITSMEYGAGVTRISRFASFSQTNCTSITVLNPNAIFEGSAIFAQRDDLVLYGYEGSTTEAYAASKSITFVALD